MRVSHDSLSVRDTSYNHDPTWQVRKLKKEVNVQGQAAHLCIAGRDLDADFKSNAISIASQWLSGHLGLLGEVFLFD